MLSEKECPLVLGLWADTAEATNPKQQQQVNAEVSAKYQDLKQVEVARQVLQIVRSHQLPGAFKPMRFSERCFKQIFASMVGELHYKHIPHRFLGAVVPWDPPNTKALSAQDAGDMLHLCAILQRQILEPLFKLQK